ncbi:heavy-metal-associated domain-containing protein [Carnobacterium sp.]|uniref:heavy-metal-associated domain-containing protein n=1 Tax=Carnobacterium sp. TaxID=48221 RepID=UPI00388FC999
MEKALFLIEPLECNGCAKKIANQINALKGIEFVKVFPQLGKILISFDSKELILYKVEDILLQTGHHIYSKITA